MRVGTLLHVHLCPCRFECFWYYIRYCINEESDLKMMPGVRFLLMLVAGASAASSDVTPYSLTSVATNLEDLSVFKEDEGVVGFDLRFESPPNHTPTHACVCRHEHSTTIIWSYELIIRWSYNHIITRSPCFIIV